MSWIKRNLYFVIGGVVALALMGLAGWYLYDNWQSNSEVLAKLNEQYSKLQELNDEKPHPGAPSGPVDNIKNAKAYEEELRAYMQKARAYFQPIPAIPASTNVNNQEFTAALRRTIDQLQHDASVASASLPQDVGGYSFSFTAQRPRVTFATNSLKPLSVQLGEVKAICDVLFAAKINSLDSLRRERVSIDDQAGLVTDYLNYTSTTNEMAVIAPYEVCFRGFSTELAAVLSGFASSPYGLVVKNINVELANASSDIAANASVPEAAPVPVQMMGLRMANGQGMQVPPGMPGGPGARSAAEIAGGQATARGAKGAMPVVLDERPLRITLTVNVIKLLPSK